MNSKNKSRTEERNNFVSYCNEHSRSFEIIQKELLNYNIYLDNLTEIFRNTIFELCDKFEDKGIDFFDANDSYSILRNAILNRLIKQLEKEVEIINTLITLINNTEKQFIKSKHINIKIYIRPKSIEQEIKKLIDAHKQICKFVKNYSLEKDLEQTLIIFLSNDNYNTYTLENYHFIFESLKKVLKELGLSKQFIEIEPQLIDLIQSQEEKSKQYTIRQDDNPLQDKNVTATPMTKHEYTIKLSHLKRTRKYKKNN